MAGKAKTFQMTEEQEQVTLMSWCSMNTWKWPEVKLLFHIPNGGKRNAAEAGRFKAAGVKAGVPDLFLPVPRNGHNGLFIEMKRTDGGRATESQKGWIKDLREQGYVAEICRGWQEAAEVIAAYLGEGRSLQEALGDGEED